MPVIIDSKITFEEAVKGSTAPREVIESLELLDVQYYGTDSQLHMGQIMVNKDIVEDIKHIFDVIYHSKFPIHKVVPLSAYDWDDNRSMEDNNSGSFCYRKIAGTDRVSIHSYGRAIDINPLFNPLVYYDPQKPNIPKGAVYDIKRSGTLCPGLPIVRAFTERGFLWGARTFQQYSDYQHFDKVLNHVCVLDELINT